MNEISDGESQVYGEFETTMSQIVMENKTTFELNSSEGVQGILEFSNVVYSQNPNFLSILRSGWQLSISCSIDFTASNGELSDPDSLHF